MSKCRKGFYDEDVMIQTIIEEHKMQRYIFYDFETDTSTLTHRPNHVEIDCVEVDPELTHEYDKCLRQSLAFNGYDCNERFCEWLFTKENTGSAVIAHNGAGYDNKFVLKWCLSRGFRPEAFIRQGSRIAYMSFRKYNIRFVDSFNFFMCRLKDLSKTFDIDTLKGHFPHHFNTEENQTYIGKIPDEEMFGASAMSVEDYISVKHLLVDGIKSCNLEFSGFLPWYRQQKETTDWNFKEELIRYCRADVELLGKAVLKFRKLFLETVDTDPFRYVTLASLCMSVYRNNFMPEKAIVSLATDKTVSLVSKEWLVYLNDAKLIPEHTVYIIDGETTKVYTVDALDKKNKIIKEFNGCYWHGCPKCHPENKLKYDETARRKELLEKQGYRVDEMWECEWNELKKTIPNRLEIEQKARDQFIIVRDALFGGRTEAFKSYYKCNENDKKLPL